MVLKKVPWRIPKKTGGGGQGHLNFFQTKEDFFSPKASLIHTTSRGWVFCCNVQLTLPCYSACFGENWQRDITIQNCFNIHLSIFGACKAVGISWMGWNLQYTPWSQPPTVCVHWAPLSSLHVYQRVYISLWKFWWHFLMFLAIIKKL